MVVPTRGNVSSSRLADVDAKSASIPPRLIEKKNMSYVKKSRSSHRPASSACVITNVCVKFSLSPSTKQSSEAYASSAVLLRDVQAIEGPTSRMEKMNWAPLLLPRPNIAAAQPTNQHEEHGKFQYDQQKLAHL